MWRRGLEWSSGAEHMPGVQEDFVLATAATTQYHCHRVQDSGRGTVAG